MTALPQPADFITASQFDQLREARDMLVHTARAIQLAAGRLDASFSRAVALLAECRGAVVVSGMGKAGLIGRKLAATLSSTGTRALFLHPAEAVHGDLGSLQAGDVLLALSNSGETEELCRLLPIVRGFSVPVVALTARSASTLGLQADVTVVTGSIAEAGHFGLAPTTSTAVLLALGDALALVVSRVRGFSREQFAVLHPGGALGRKLKCVADVMRSGADLRIAAEGAAIRTALAEARRSGRRTGAVIAVDADGRLSGLFTDSDLVRLLEQRRDAQLDRPLSEVMTQRPKTIGPESPVADACALLAQHRISELPVVDDDGRPVGLVDITDIIELMPEDRRE